jgi:DNA repair photolyase
MFMAGNTFNQQRTGTGTKEWAESTYNIGKGCAHGCLYCYTCHIQLHYHKIGSRQEWLEEKLNPNAAVIKSQRKGIIMFPSSHDITPNYLDPSIAALEQMLSVGNNVLIVSKPHLECIRTLINQLDKFKKQIQFRFTIGALVEELTRFWEPQAPPPEERLEALAYAYATGFSTSISVEPMLAGVEETLQVVKAVNHHVTDTIWIGKMNRIRERVDMSKPEIVQAVEIITHQQSDAEIRILHQRLKNNPKIRWKESIQKVLKIGSHVMGANIKAAKPNKDKKGLLPGPVCF